MSMTSDYTSISTPALQYRHNNQSSQLTNNDNVTSTNYHSTYLEVDQQLMAHHNANNGSYYNNIPTQHPRSYIPTDNNHINYNISEQSRVFTSNNHPQSNTTTSIHTESVGSNIQRPSFFYNNGNDQSNLSQPQVHNSEVNQQLILQTITDLRMRITELEAQYYRQEERIADLTNRLKYISDLVNIDTMSVSIPSSDTIVETISVDAESDYKRSYPIVYARIINHPDYDPRYWTYSIHGNPLYTGGMSARELGHEAAIFTSHLWKSVPAKRRTYFQNIRSPRLQWLLGRYIRPFSINHLPTVL